MKLSKTAWSILGIGAFVIVAAVLVMLLTGNSSEARKIEDNLEVTQTLLNKLVSEREELNSQLVQLNNELEAAADYYDESLDNFPEDIKSIEYDEEIFSIAGDTNLDVLSLIASEPRKVVIDDITFQATLFEVEVRGTTANILTFIDDIANGGYFTTATVDLVNLEVPPVGQNELPVGLTKIIIYSYEYTEYTTEGEGE
ncbi:MAG: hypothetical protein PVJ61_02615 [Dehalococcoidia bacterium]|jgi:hypothetical protein